LLVVADQDVLTAFKVYKKQWGKGRPLILAGHSQGSAHAMRLLVEEIAPDRELCDKLSITPVKADGLKSTSEVPVSGCETEVRHHRMNCLVVPATPLRYVHGL
jgi:hypothetical protein